MIKINYINNRDSMNALEKWVNLQLFVGKIFRFSSLNGKIGKVEELSVFDNCWRENNSLQYCNYMQDYQIEYYD